MGPMNGLDDVEQELFTEWQHKYNEALQVENEIRLQQAREETEHGNLARSNIQDDELARRLGFGVGVQLPFGLGAGLSSGLGNGGFGLNAGLGFRGGYTRFGERPHYSQYYVPQQQSREILEQRALALSAQAGLGLGPVGAGASFGAGQGQIGLNAGLGWRGGYHGFGTRPHWIQYFLTPNGPRAY